MSRRPSRRQHSAQKTYRITVGDVIVSGTREQVEKKLEALGYEAERAKDHVLAQTYFQTAEHYKKDEEPCQTNK